MIKKLLVQAALYLAAKLYGFAFNAIDTDKNGQLSKPEIESAVEKAHAMTSETLSNLFSK